MSHPKSNPVPSPEDAAQSGFSAQSQMGLPEVLQMCCLSRRSGQITFRSGESYGFVYIQQGGVLHALCGTTEGEEAIYAMLLWPGGGFSLDEDILPHKRTITLTWEQLLFEGARRADHGLLRPVNGKAITTAEPITVRIQDSQPKLTITRPDQNPIVYQLAQEYTHVGRSANNEIALPYPSISNRHCIFIHSGPDIVLRDLNSSNGTYVNGEIISEVILRPGDMIQTGSVTMKFEPGVKRPKLTAQEAAPKAGEGELKTEGTTGALYYQTVKMPQAANARAGAKASKTKDDSEFLKGQSAISYDHLAKPVEKKPSKLPLIITIVVILAVLGGGGYYYFVVMNGGAPAPANAAAVAPAATPAPAAAPTPAPGAAPAPAPAATN